VQVAELAAVNGDQAERGVWPGLGQEGNALAARAPAVAAGHHRAGQTDQLAGSASGRVEPEQAGAEPAAGQLLAPDDEEVVPSWRPAQIQQALVGDTWREGVAPRAELAVGLRDPDLVQPAVDAQSGTLPPGEIGDASTIRGYGERGARLRGAEAARPPLPVDQPGLPLVVGRQCDTEGDPAVGQEAGTRDRRTRERRPQLPNPRGPEPELTPEHRDVPRGEADVVGRVGVPIVTERDPMLARRERQAAWRAAVDAAIDVNGRVRRPAAHVERHLAAVGAACGLPARARQDGPAGGDQPGQEEPGPRASGGAPQR
jgi:hypothetical protein